ncbi:helix-turn-helix domain-containing protein [Streptomyces anulatus]|uniref:MarR family transcriptional regulator n=1 Tax=Streptomyces anulatus TaxID=1892 RepID=UPI00224FF37F|nr:helix-turn-helix domain-containing protein [Streptomyces anulatus]MCX4524060.1 MarR family transcriptional regulator [Streptomyces anulatus]WTD15228.1 MarR family transcriptional regulator [Streptomyces anulatus]WTE08720.1 MarR family transcriptional regulator [Streptomyces anulatus]
MSTLKWSATNADGLLADLDLPPAAYRALLKIRAQSESGGRIAMDQGTLGKLLGLSRPSVNAALRELELAKLVKKVRNGVYQINPMLAGYDCPEDALDAVKAMPRADRLDSKTYVSDYHRAVAAYQDQLAEQRKKRADAAAAKKAAATRRRGSLHAVG